MKFKVKATGVILETDNKFSIEQMKKSSAYEVYEGKKSKTAEAKADGDGGAEGTQPDVDTEE